MKKIVLLAFLIQFYSLELLHAQFLGGQAKSANTPYPPGTVHCNPQNKTAVVEVVSLTGKIWMDRNLGAERVATSATDALAFGDLYQWGRGADGHQCRNSGTRTTVSVSNQPGHDDFILVPTTSATDDWRNPQNEGLWQGINGINNPCPTGFRLPTDVEVRDERRSWTGGNNSVGAFNSVLKLPLSGYRDQTAVVFATAQGSPYGFIWTSSPSGTGDPTDSEALAYFSGNAFENPYVRARGYSVRCIKN